MDGRKGTSIAQVVVGVDGGSTKTIALVADSEGHILGAGRSGNCNWYAVGKEGAKAAISTAVLGALHQAGLGTHTVSYAFYCITGADWPEDHPMLEGLLGTLGLSERLAVKNDVFAAFRAGTRDPFGAVICAGTGTNTAIIAPDGREFVYGFWVDYGGAGSVAQGAIQAVLRAADGRGEPTILTDGILSYFGLRDAEALLRAITGGLLSKQAILAACPLVFQASAEGDPVARALVVRQGHELALYATAGIRRFGMTALGFDLVLSGSLFKGGDSLLTDTIRQDVLQIATHARIVRAHFEPAVGAVMLALEARGVPLGDVLLTRLSETQPGPEIFATGHEMSKMPGRQAEES